MSVSTYDAEVIDAGSYKDNMPGIEIFDSRRFFSEGPNGRFELRTFIAKVETNSRQDLFNVGFGVWSEELQMVDDMIQTRNGDFRRILSTIAIIALDFLQRYPFAFLFAEGSTRARTRLYQREISNILDEIPKELRLYGFIKMDDIFIDFQKGINFDGFLLSLRNH
ncbi:DUF6934 family protein [Dyadobacter luticola]|uniref:Uncharacterized protein n=1 Tax=Dyadobacter luticola TaxID=1979387 RepID=A0A5R9KYX3_9BACT|nr:hypothetical protein [Dyadobacter luticola]TLV01506.1 hypothetical protein FEN17_18950 [Dyadobacter luticola]